MDWDETKFCGRVMAIAEDEFAGNNDGDFSSQLYRDWLAEGAPKNVDEWIRGRLKELFRCAADRPIWPRDPQWSFLNGKPMLFLGQMRVPPYKFPEGHQSTGYTIVFVFGAPEGPPNGWSMVFKTLELFEAL